MSYCRRKLKLRTLTLASTLPVPEPGMGLGLQEFTLNKVLWSASSHIHSTIRTGVPTGLSVFQKMLVQKIDNVSVCFTSDLLSVYSNGNKLHDIEITSQDRDAACTCKSCDLLNQSPILTAIVPPAI